MNYRRGTPGADVKAVPAWDLSTGAGVAIGVVDTGVRYDDSDLAANMWESPGLTIDGKTCPPGTHGYDFHQDDCQPYDGSGHGTGVATVAGAAAGNDVGGVGLAFDARLMALRVGKVPVLSTTTNSALARAVRWAVEAREQRVNVRVLNLSWGGNASSGALHAAIREAGEAGILVVAGSGNDSNRNNDEQPTYPCAYDVPTLICVGGSDQDDGVIGNWGPTTVDLVAPASNVYGCGTGTSCAAPLVSAAAALIWSREPNLSVAEVRGKILTNVDPLPDPDDRAKVATGGRLNAYRALTGPTGLSSGSPPTTTPPSGGGPSGGSGGGSPPPGNGSPEGGALPGGGEGSPLPWGATDPALPGGTGGSVEGSSGAGASETGKASSRGSAEDGGSPGAEGVAASDALADAPGDGALPAAARGDARVTLDEHGSGGSRRWPYVLGTLAATLPLAGFGGWHLYRRHWARPLESVVDLAG